MRWLFSLIFCLSVYSVQAAYVVTNTGRQINGSDIAVDHDGAVTIKTESGQSMTFQKGQYRMAVADRPMALNKASALLLDGQYESAVSLLKEVSQNYRHLAWDQEAIRMLADHYYVSEQFGPAAKEYRKLAVQDAETESRIRRAMMKSGDTGSVAAVLDQDIISGAREAAANAYLMRGDLKAEEGNAAGARRDWLKVMIYFKAQKETVLQASDRLENLE